MALAPRGAAAGGTLPLRTTHRPIGSPRAGGAWHILPPRSRPFPEYPAMQFALDVNALIQGGVLALLLYIAKLLVGMAKWQAQTTIVLTGVNGNNGLVGDVKSLRERTHEHGDKLHGHAARLQLVEHDVAELKEAAA